MEHEQGEINPGVDRLHQWMKTRLANEAVIQIRDGRSIIETTLDNVQLASGPGQEQSLINAVVKARDRLPDRLYHTPWGYLDKGDLWHFWRVTFQIAREKDKDFAGFTSPEEAYEFYQNEVDQDRKRLIEHVEKNVLSAYSQEEIELITRTINSLQGLANQTAAIKAKIEREGQKLGAKYENKCGVALKVLADYWLKDAAPPGKTERVEFALQNIAFHDQHLDDLMLEIQSADARILPHLRRQVDVAAGESEQISLVEVNGDNDQWAGKVRGAIGLLPPAFRGGITAVNAKLAKGNDWEILDTSTGQLTILESAESQEITPNKMIHIFSWFAAQDTLFLLSQPELLMEYLSIPLEYSGFTASSEVDRLVKAAKGEDRDRNLAQALQVRLGVIIATALIKPKNLHPLTQLWAQKYLSIRLPGYDIRQEADKKSDWCSLVENEVGPILADKIINQPVKLDKNELRLLESAYQRETHRIEGGRVARKSQKGTTSDIDSARETYRKYLHLARSLARCLSLRSGKVHSIDLPLTVEPDWMFDDRVDTSVFRIIPDSPRRYQAEGKNAKEYSTLWSDEVMFVKVEPDQYFLRVTYPPPRYDGYTLGLHGHL